MLITTQGPAGLVLLALQAGAFACCHFAIGFGAALGAAYFALIFCCPGRFAGGKLATGYTFTNTGFLVLLALVYCRCAALRVGGDNAGKEYEC